MTSVSSVFVLSSAEFEAKNVKRSNIFVDVEDAKLRLLAMRRAAKRRLEESNNGLSEQSTGSFPVSEPKAQNGFSIVLQSLLEAETSLQEVRSQRAALEARKLEIEDLVKDAKSELRELELKDVVELQPPDEPMHAPKKKQRYFESDAPVPTERFERKLSEDKSSSYDDDLSSIVCPFESLGKCTDLLGCPHLHLNR